MKLKIVEELTCQVLTNLEQHHPDIKILIEHESIRKYTQQAIETAIKQCAEIASTRFAGTNEKIVGDCIEEAILNQIESKEPGDIIKLSKKGYHDVDEFYKEEESELKACIKDLNTVKTQDPMVHPELIKSLITISERLDKLENIN